MRMVLTAYFDDTENYDASLLLDSTVFRAKRLGLKKGFYVFKFIWF